MSAAALRKFDAVRLDHYWGIANATGFHQSESRFRAPAGYPFSTCLIEGQRIAVFLETVPYEIRAELASRRPDWLDDVVFASVTSDPRAQVAVVEARVADAEALETRAFAAACVAFNLGLFDVFPDSYLVRFEGGTSVRVRMEFDEEQEAWFGAAASQSLPAPPEPAERP